MEAVQRNMSESKNVVMGVKDDVMREIQNL